MKWGARTATRPDTDQPEIVKRLKQAGFSVELIGRPLDLLIGREGVTLLAEVKGRPGPKGGVSGKGRQLRDSQRKFIEEWRGSRPLVLVLDSCVEKALEAIEGERRCHPGIR